VPTRALNYTATGLVRLVARLEPGGRLVRSRRLRGGIGARMDALEIERADGTRRKITLRRFTRSRSLSRPERVALEYRKLQLVEQAGIPAPRLLLLDGDGTLFGVPAIALTYLPGAPLYWPRNVVSWTMQLAQAMLRIHAVTPGIHDLSFLPGQRPRDSLRETLEEDRPRVKKHSALARDTHAALLAEIDHIDWSGPTFIHEDFWPGNTVWYRGRLTGVIDWTAARVGDQREDVAQCALDLSLINGVDVAETFVRAYEVQNGRPVEQLWFFALLRGLHALLSYEFWFEGYQDAQLPHMTKPHIRGGIEGSLRSALRARRAERL
jgi:aminoglycoside phosphotransferase (APT) family kinase protein